MKASGGRGRSRDAGDIELPDVVDSVSQHREPFEPVADTDRRVALRIATEMTDDPVGEDTPREHLRPVAVGLDLELPCLAAHRVLRRHDLHRAAGEHAIHRLQHARRHLPLVETVAVVEPQGFSLVERFEVRGVNLAQPIRLSRCPEPQRLGRRSEP